MPKSPSQDYLYTIAQNLKKLAGDTPWYIIAKQCGLPVSTMSRLCNAQRSPNLSTMLSIAQYFGVSLDWLCGYTPKYGDVFSPSKVLYDLYAQASQNDKEVIDLILSKYQEKGSK